MSGIANKTGSTSGVVGTTEASGTPSEEPTFTKSIKITPQASEPVAAGSNAGVIWMDSDDGLMRISDGTKYRSVSSLQASGGVVTQYSGYISHTFTSSADFLVHTDLTADFMLVGGGGSGGAGYVGPNGNLAGGGGGAGGMNVWTSQTVTAGVKPIVVGAGAALAPSQGGLTGSSSTFNGQTSGGGGGGGRGSVNAFAGASGGGAGGGGPVGYHGGSSNAPGGYAGGPTFATINPGATHGGGGGGGAAGVGSNVGYDNCWSPGPPGAGVANAYKTGSNITYSVGGQGGKSLNQGQGDSGGGVNTGGGGGGGNSPSPSMPSVAGSSGIVVVRYAV